MPELHVTLGRHDLVAYAIEDGDLPTITIAIDGCTMRIQPERPVSSAVLAAAAMLAEVAERFYSDTITEHERHDSSGPSGQRSA